MLHQQHSCCHSNTCVTLALISSISSSLNSMVSCWSWASCSWCSSSSTCFSRPAIWRRKHAGNNQSLASSCSNIVLYHRSQVLTVSMVAGLSVHSKGSYTMYKPRFIVRWRNVTRRAQNVNHYQVYITVIISCVYLVLEPRDGIIETIFLQDPVCTLHIHRHTSYHNVSWNSYDSSCQLNKAWACMGFFFCIYIWNVSFVSWTK